jgi:hypothetical protein
LGGKKALFLNKCMTVKSRKLKYECTIIQYDEVALGNTTTCALMTTVLRYVDCYFFKCFLLKALRKIQRAAFYGKIMVRRGFHGDGMGWT